MIKPSCVILAAGNSSRMGVLKPFLKFNEEFNFLENIINNYLKTGVENIVIVVNQSFLDDATVYKIPLLKKCTLVLNEHPEYGRPYSMKIGLHKSGSKSPVFVQNIDNPFLQQATLNLMQSSIMDADVAIPSYQGRNGHPVLIAKAVIKTIIRNTNYDLNFRELIQSFRHVEVKVSDPGILVNINTPEDYSIFFSYNSRIIS